MARAADVVVSNRTEWSYISTHTADCDTSALYTQSDTPGMLQVKKSGIELKSTSHVIRNLFHLQLKL